MKIQTIKTEATTFTIYSQKLAGYLMQKGFILIDMQEDIKPTGRNVFLFKNTPQLRTAIDEYMRNI